MEGHPFYPSGPPAVHGGFSGSGFTGFSDYLKNKGFANNKDLLSILPDLDTIQQIKIDMVLHKDDYNDNNDWKKELIQVFKGKNDPKLIKRLISIISNDIKAHKHSNSKLDQALRQVYKQWLEKLYEKEKQH